MIKKKQKTGCFNTYATDNLKIQPEARKSKCLKINRAGQQHHMKIKQNQSTFRTAESMLLLFWPRGGRSTLTKEAGSGWNFAAHVTESYSRTEWSCAGRRKELWNEKWGAYDEVFQKELNEYNAIVCSNSEEYYCLCIQESKMRQFD